MCKDTSIYQKDDGLEWTSTMKVLLKPLLTEGDNVIEPYGTFSPSFTSSIPLQDSSWWLEKHITEPEKFEEVLATHRTRLINTPEIAVHFNQSTLIQLCSLDTTEALRLFMYHLSGKNFGLQDAFEQYCQDHHDLKVFLVCQKQSTSLASRLSQLSPKTTPSLPLPKYIKFSTSRPLSVVTERKEIIPKKIKPPSSILDNNTSISSDSTYNTSSSHSLTYNSAKQVIALTAPASINGGVQPNEKIEIGIELQGKHLPWSQSTLFFSLVGTCQICHFKPKWHANFSTERNCSTTYSIFSLSNPPKSQYIAAGEQLGTYRLLATILLPDQGTMQYMFNITGVPGLTSQSSPDKSRKTYTTSMPITPCRITRSKALGADLSVMMNDRATTIKILVRHYAILVRSFSWKVMPQKQTTYYIIRLKAYQSEDNVAQKLKQIAQKIHVRMIWKSQPTPTSLVKSKTLQEGRHHDMAFHTCEESIEKWLKIEGSIPLPARSKYNDSVCLANSWYGLNVNSSLTQPESLLFSVPLRD
ncbi:uncharacterized protein MELLADRAFT_64437 [Melampsora larici-populina 98AG31]|uniref:Uncharacterized protein n=1 Tax=Melampsora larici-populina (strain 98AG31 / pathotype 3-4-7) TaxID=747676 RepID=F4RRF7_MELLP|nr:uncharacterized protein MELLADRAFT_64437 [Melampsora larici-populina 98AG31]EGG05041.1 hypothetical protein MELLADRAFT_64437 [Melampsora larici-populina 98AG31]